MKHLKLYEEYTRNLDHPGFLDTYEKVKTWLDMYGVEDYIINDDLSVDVSGYVNLNRKNLKYIPVQFGEVSGHFNCSNNQITSLTGAPRKVDGDFHCHINYLTSLTGAPSEVGLNFDCSNNQITSLIGCPSYVGWCFYCSNNKLTSLTGAPSSVGVDFSCSDNQLTSLTGGPSYVGGAYNCSNNQLTSLTGAPNIISGFFNKDNYLTIIDEPYDIGVNNPGYEETILPKIVKNFLDKLETSELDSTTQLRILRSLETSKPKVYSELGKLVDLDDWLSRLQNSQPHTDIINL